MITVGNFLVGWPYRNTVSYCIMVGAGIFIGISIANGRADVSLIRVMSAILGTVLFFMALGAGYVRCCAYTSPKPFERPHT